MSDPGDADVLEPETSRGIRPPVFVVGLVAVLAVVFLIGRALFFDAGGASSAEEAVRDLADAISREDLAGALAALSPDEVGPIAETYTAGADKAKELGLTGEGGTFGFLDLEVTDLQLDVQELGPDVAKVVIADGRATASFDSERLGPKVRELEAGILGDSSASSSSGGMTFAEELGEVVPAPEDDGEQDEPATGEVTADDLRADIDGEEVDPFVIAVHRDDGWYVSPFHTIAEYLMIGADDEVPRASYARPELAPAAPSPIAAVQQMVDAINARDVGAAIDSLSAEEWAVLHTYRGAVEYLLEDALGEIDPAADLQIDDIQFTARQTGDERAVVVPKTFRAHVVIPESEEYFEEFEELDEFDAESVDGLEGFDEEQEVGGDIEVEGFDEPEASSGPTTVSIEFDGTCLRWDDGDEPFDSCAVDDELASSIDGISRFGLLGIRDGSGFDAGALDESGIVVVAERGGWAISPLETVFGALTHFIESIDAASFASITGTQSTLPPQAKVSMGQSTEVTINEHGFAVLGVKATEGEAFELTVEGEGASVGEITDPDGQAADGTDEGFSGFSSDPEGVEPDQTGEYRAVIHGTAGSTVTVTMQPYERTIVDLGEQFDVHLTQERPGQVVTVRVPESGFIAIEGDERLIMVDDAELYGRVGPVDAGELQIEISTDSMEGRIDGSARIVELEPEPIDVTATTEVSLDGSEMRVFSFTTADGHTVPEVNGLLATTYEAGSGEVVDDQMLEEGVEYLMVVEPRVDSADGTVAFTGTWLSIDGDFAASSFWDPEMGEDSGWFELVVPADQAAVLFVAPDSALDVELEVACGIAEPNVVLDDLGPGENESLLIDAAAEVRICEVTVSGKDVGGDYTVAVNAA